MLEKILSCMNKNILNLVSIQNLLFDYRKSKHSRKHENFRNNRKHFILHLNIIFISA